MNYIDDLNLFGIRLKEIPCIRQSSDPTTSTEGAVGSLYMNTENGKLFKCIAANNQDEIYTWEKFIELDDIAQFQTRLQMLSDLVADTKDQFDTRAEEVLSIASSSNYNPEVTIPYSSEITIAANTVSNIELLSGDISITLGEPVSGVSNEWDFIITQGIVEYDISLPDIKWGLGIAPTFSANTSTICRLYYVNNELRGEWSD